MWVFCVWQAPWKWSWIVHLAEKEASLSSQVKTCLVQTFSIKTLILLLGRTGCMQAEKHYSGMDSSSTYSFPRLTRAFLDHCAKRRMFLFSTQLLLGCQLHIPVVSWMKQQSFNLKSLISCKLWHLAFVFKHYLKCVLKYKTQFYFSCKGMQACIGSNQKNRYYLEDLIYYWKPPTVLASMNGCHAELLCVLTYDFEHRSRFS